MSSSSENRLALISGWLMDSPRSPSSGLLPRCLWRRPLVFNLKLLQNRRLEAEGGVLTRESEVDDRSMELLARRFDSSGTPMIMSIYLLNKFSQRYTFNIATMFCTDQDSFKNNWSSCPYSSLTSFINIQIIS